MQIISTSGSERRLVYRTALFLLLGVVLGAIGTASAREPTLLEIFTRLGFTNIVEVSDETFPTGTYDLHLLAEFTVNRNTIGYYPVGTDQFQALITGSEGNFGFINPPVTHRFVTQAQFGLAIFTPMEQLFFTERARNNDGMQHARIFRDLNAPRSFLIGFEDRAEGDQDFQDVVLALTQVAANPTIRSNTFELLSYQASGYRFQILPQDAIPPRGFAQPNFDDAAFDTGSAAFGAGRGGAGNGRDCPLRRTVQTNWSLETQLLIRRVVSIPEGATTIRIMMSVDNDIIGVFFNGVRVPPPPGLLYPITHEECPIMDEFRFDIPRS
jgi:hypothetical protein